MCCSCVRLSNVPPAANRFGGTEKEQRENETADLAPTAACASDRSTSSPIRTSRRVPFCELPSIPEFHRVSPTPSAFNSCFSSGAEVADYHRRSGISPCPEEARDSVVVTTRDVPHWLVTHPEYTTARSIQGYRGARTAWTISLVVAVFSM